jgi:hypothetical protein
MAANGRGLAHPRERRRFLIDAPPSIRGVAHLWRQKFHLANSWRYTNCMSELPAARYRTTNWPSYDASLRKRGLC